MIPGASSRGWPEGSPKGLSVCRLAVLLCLCATWARAASGARAPGTAVGQGLARGRAGLVIAVVNQVTWHDLLDEKTNAPTLRRLVREGAVGMMCVRAARGTGPEGAYLSIGAGARVAASGREKSGAGVEGEAYQRGELVNGVPAGQCYRTRTGWEVDDNAIVHLGIGALLQENAPSSYPVHIGLLGGALRRAGLRVACVGNADTLLAGASGGAPALPRAAHREVVGIGMDEQGLVPLGNVGRDLLRWQADLPYGYTTDAAAMRREVARALAEADLVVIELGETTRAAEYAALATPGAAQWMRRRAIEKSDRMLADVLSLLPAAPGGGWALLVVTPAVRPPGPGEQFAALAPVIMFGPGVRAGLLTSPSTRRAGVVANTDIVTTALAYFGLAGPPDTMGRAMVSEETRRDHAEWVKEQVGRQDTVEVGRRYVFRWLPIHTAVAMWLAAFLLLLGQRAPRWARVVVRGLLLVALATPAAALLVAFFPLSVVQTAAAVMGGAAALALVGCWLTGWRSAHSVSAVLVVGLLAYDLVFGQQMLAWSPLSYSVASGARFYGIGNELAGALLGGALMGAAALLPGRGRSWSGERFAAALALTGLMVMVGHPRLGANFGMAAGCGIGFGLFALYLWREQPGWREVALVFWVAFGAMGAVVLVDLLMRGAEASHVGLLAGQVRELGWPVVWQAVERKLAMNWVLVRGSPWTDVVAAAGGLFAVVLAARPQTVLAASDEREWLRAAVVACAVGAVGSFLLNDSGVVAAALVLLYGAGSLAYLGLGELPGAGPGTA